MGESTGKQSLRTELSDAAALLDWIEAHRHSAYAQIGPLKGLLPVLRAYVHSTEARITALEVLTAPLAQRAWVERRALTVIEHATREGMLDGAIQDEARPGGARQGDQIL